MHHEHIELNTARKITHWLEFSVKFTQTKIQTPIQKPPIGGENEDVLTLLPASLS